MTVTSDLSFLLSLINHQTYPIDRLDYPRRTQSITSVCESLAVDGCAVIRDFPTPFGLKCILDEVIERRSKAHFDESPHTNAGQTVDTEAG